jgi:hypothetical protein
VEHTPFLKKIAACQSVCEIVKLSGFERPQKRKTFQFFFINITNIFTTQKILKMENQRQQFCSASNSLSENKEKLSFEKL